MKKLLFIFVCFLFITGCSDKEYVIESKDKALPIINYKKLTEVEINEIIGKNVEASKEVIVNVDKQDNNIIADTTVNFDYDVLGKADNGSIDVSIESNDVVDFFKNGYNKVYDLVNNFNISDAKVRCREVFISFVDFIFYGSEIKGVTFDELTDDVKSSIVDIVKKTDDLISSRFPNYKESMSNKMRGYIESLKDYIQGKIDSNPKVKENYEQFKEDVIESYEKSHDVIDSSLDKNSSKIEEAKEKAKSLIEKGKEKLSNWYQNFKNKE